MIPAIFPEANHLFTRPPGLEECQCGDVKAYVGQVVGGSLDGVPVAVTAWQPTADEMLQIAEGKPIFLSMIGSMPPHLLSPNFHTATHPA